MKIAVVSNMYPDEKHPSYGVFVKNFCNILDDINIDYKLHVMLKADSPIEKMLRYAKFYIGTTIALLFEKYDLIYVHYASHSSLPVLWARRIRKKQIYTNVHGSDVIPENSKQERLQKYTGRILSISEKIITPSEYFRKLVGYKYEIGEDKIFVSPSGGINNKVFYKEREKVNDGCLKLGYVGRISHKKGWDTLLNACSHLDIPYELIVVGNGPEYRDMYLLANKLNINNNIRWIDLQPQEKLRELYNIMDVFVFPTEREGESLGLVALEAMACGTPVIASDYAAPKYYVENNKNGYKYSCGDSSDLKNKIEYFYRLDEDTRRELGKNAEITARNYDYDRRQNEIRMILDLQ